MISRLRGMATAAACGVTLVAGLACAPAANATSYLLISGAMTNSRAVQIGSLGTALSAPMQFQVSVNNAKPMTLAAWCVDVYHHITLSTGYANGGLNYSDGASLTTDFSPAKTALDGGDTLKVGLLANYGYDLFNDVPVKQTLSVEMAATLAAGQPKLVYPPGSTTAQKQAIKATYDAKLIAFNAAKKADKDATTLLAAQTADRFMRLQAVQSAIWQVVSDFDVTSVKADAAYDLLVDHLSGQNLDAGKTFGDYFLGGYGAQYAGGYGHQGKDFTLITPDPVITKYVKGKPVYAAATQSFVFANVPEPATWALMIVGFGAVGGALRARRRQDAVAA